MNAIYSSKEKIEKIIDLEESKVWLSKKQGKRMECIFTLGSEQFIDSIIIYEDESYLLRGQNISNQLKNKITHEVDFYE